MPSVISAEPGGALTQSGTGGRAGEGRSWGAPSPLVCGLGFGPEGEGAGREVWLPEELRSKGRGDALVQSETS